MLPLGTIMNLIKETYIRRGSNLTMNTEKPYSTYKCGPVLAASNSDKIEQYDDILGSIWFSFGSYC